MRINWLHILLIIPLLAGCRGASKDVIVTGDADLATLEGVTSVRYLVVTGTTLVDLTVFESLREAEGITIQANPNLTSLRGLENVRRLDGLVVAENASLATLDGLEGLSRVGDLVLAANPALADVDAIAGLEVDGERDVDTAARELALGR